MRLIILFITSLVLQTGCSTKPRHEPEFEQNPVQTEKDNIDSAAGVSEEVDYCKLNERIDTLNSILTVRFIDQQEFKRLADIHANKSTPFKTLNSDSLEGYCQQNFIKVFNLKDSAYTFKAWGGYDIKVFKRITNNKDYENYKFISINCGNVIIYSEAYESWGYLVVDPKTGIASGTLGEPNFIDCSFYYSTSNYYGEEEISVVDLENKKAATLLFNDWQTEQVFNINRELVYKVKNRRCEDGLRYLVIRMD